MSPTSESRAAAVESMAAAAPLTAVEELSETAATCGGGAAPESCEKVSLTSKLAGATEPADEKNVQRRTMTLTILVPIIVVVLLACGYVVIQLTSAIHASGVPTLPFGLQLLLELVACMYILDLVTGLAHLNFDYQAIQNKELYLHKEVDVAGIQKFNKHDPLFLMASKEDQFLWNFQVHHDVPYPAADTDFDLVMQIARPVMVVPPLLVLGYCVGLRIPAYLLRSIVMFTALAPAANHIHIWAHARTRNLIRSPVYRFMQDWHLVLNPDVHRKHHEEYDCNFCLFTGWANPVINRLAALLRHLDVIVREPPTVTMRRQRDLHTGADRHVAADKSVATKARAA